MLLCVSICFKTSDSSPARAPPPKSWMRILLSPQAPRISHDRSSHANIQPSVHPMYFNESNTCIQGISN